MPRLKKRKAPPSRIKYEKTHPTITCRLPKELYDRLSGSRDVDGKSFADILKLGLGIAEKQDNELVETKKAIWDEGYRKGYAEAEERYKITFPCSKCGELLEITHPDVKAAVQKFMTDRGWGHTECPNSSQ